MAIDIYIQSYFPVLYFGGNKEFICSLDDDGYYWFLYPLFEKLAAETGQLIDPYDITGFGGNSLDALAQTLSVARDIVDQQPDTWEVVTGFLTGTTPEEIRDQVDKQQMYALLNTLDATVRKAAAADAFVTFFGD